MAELCDTESTFVQTLKPEEIARFQALHEKDLESKALALECGLEWDRSNSYAVKYLYQQLGRKENENKQTMSVGHHKDEISQPGTDEDTDTTSSSSSYSDSDTEDDSDSEEDNLMSSSQIDIPQVSKRKFAEDCVLLETNAPANGLFSRIVTGHLAGKDVVVKQGYIPLLPKDSSQEELDEKCNLIRKLCRLDHRNIAKLLGLIDIEIHAPPRFVFEHFEISLLEFLHDEYEDYPKEDYATMGKFSLDILNACEYLHRENLVHGSLAACNINVWKTSSRHESKIKLHFNIKLTICGHGLLTHGKGEDYFQASNGKLVHLRWTPKEILQPNMASVGTNAYTQQSDVWSFGVVLWEMWTQGKVPYGNLASAKEVLANILDDQSPLTTNVPKSCPKHIVGVMKSIFVKPLERPTMTSLKKTFEEFREYRNKNRVSKIKNHETSSKNRRESNDSPACQKYERVREWRQKHEASKKVEGSAKRKNYTNGHIGRGDKKFLNERPFHQRPHANLPGRRNQGFFGPRLFHPNEMQSPNMIGILCPVRDDSHGTWQSQITNDVNAIQNQLQALTCAMVNNQPGTSRNPNSERRGSLLGEYRPSQCQSSQTTQRNTGKAPQNKTNSSNSNATPKGQARRPHPKMKQNKKQNQ